MPIIRVDTTKAYDYVVDAGLLSETSAALREVLTGISTTLQERQIDVPPLVRDMLSAIATEEQEYVTFHYRRLLSTERAEIMQRHTVRGMVYNWLAREDMGKAAVTGWTGPYTDEEGAVLPFTPENVKAIPGNILIEIGARADELSPSPFLRTSFATSNGSSSSTAPPARVAEISSP